MSRKPQKYFLEMPLASDLNSSTRKGSKKIPEEDYGIAPTKVEPSERRRLIRHPPFPGKPEHPISWAWQEILAATNE
jgi:hypothetical protein